MPDTDTTYRLPKSPVHHADLHCGYLWKTRRERLVAGPPADTRPCTQCHAPSWPNGGRC